MPLESLLKIIYFSTQTVLLLYFLNTPIYFSKKKKIIYRITEVCKSNKLITHSDTIPGTLLYI